MVRTVAEVLKERWQAARQNRLNILPRVHRGWTYAGLRAATNVLQRDLNTAVIAEEMRKGTKSIYVDYVDYDEIAHHAGMFRPEAMAALDGLDRVLGTLERLSTHAARRYHIVVLSDHGQSQGQTFRDRFGADLGEVCTQLMNENVASLDAPVETWGGWTPSPEIWPVPVLQVEPPGAPPPPAANRWTTAPTPGPPASRCWARETWACCTSIPLSGSRWRIWGSAGQVSFPAYAHTRASDSSPVSIRQVCRGHLVGAAASGWTPER